MGQYNQYVISIDKHARYFFDDGDKAINFAKKLSTQRGYDKAEIVVTHELMETIWRKKGNDTRESA